MLLIVDNYDSFTYNLLDYFQQLGEECVVVKNDIHPHTINIDTIDKVVLSPGPGKPNDAGYLMDYVKLFSEKVPILGICLGHQAIASFFGAKVVKANKPMHGKLSKCYALDRHQLLNELPENWQVVRYHSLVVKWDEDCPLKSLAETGEGENMILKHKDLPLFGIQYHPEAHLTEFGLTILGNWIMDTAYFSKERCYSEIN